MTPEKVGIDILRECIHFDRGSCTSCAKKAVRAAVQAERDGNEYWGMNQELTEQIAALREALENEWRIAHND